MLGLVKSSIVIVVLNLRKNVYIQDDQLSQVHSVHVWCVGSNVFFVNLHIWLVLHKYCKRRDFRQEQHDFT